VQYLWQFLPRASISFFLQFSGRQELILKTVKVLSINTNIFYFNYILFDFSSTNADKSFLKQTQDYTFRCKKKNSTCAFGQYYRILVGGDGCHLYSERNMGIYPQISQCGQSYTYTRPWRFVNNLFFWEVSLNTHETLMHSMSRSLWTSRLATQGSVTRQTLCPTTLPLPAAWSTPKQHNTFSPFALQFKIPSLSALHRFPSTAHLHIIL
jgi:hypothetical protein